MKKPSVLVQKDCVDGPCHNLSIIRDLRKKLKASERKLKKITRERDAWLAWQKSMPVDDLKCCTGWAQNEGDDDCAWEVEAWLEKRPRVAEKKP